VPLLRQAPLAPVDADQAIVGGRIDGSRERARHDRLLRVRPRVGCRAEALGLQPALVELALPKLLREALCSPLGGALLRVPEQRDLDELLFGLHRIRIGPGASNPQSAERGVPRRSRSRAVETTFPLRSKRSSAAS
jgi:hypothetical protein